MREGLKGMNTSKSSSFVMHTEWAQAINTMSDADAGILIKALLEYVGTGVRPDIGGVPAMAFEFMRGRIDHDQEKYRQVSAARSAAAKCSKRSKCKQTSTTGPVSISESISVSDSISESVSKSISVSSSSSSPSSPSWVDGYLTGHHVKSDATYEENGRSLYFSEMIDYAATLNIAPAVVVEFWIMNVANDWQKNGRPLRSWKKALVAYRNTCWPEQEELLV